MNRLYSLVIAILAVGVVLLRPAAATAQTPSPLVITAHDLTAAATHPNGVARPGDVIRYDLVFTNRTAGPVKNLEFVDPIPKGLVYMAGTAKADLPVEVEYSIDGGKTYSAQPMIQSVENGQKVAKPAPRTLYTHIRWTVSGALAVGAKVLAQFEAQVTPGEAK